MQLIPAEELAERVGEETGVSDWFEIDQDRIDTLCWRLDQQGLRK